MLFIYISLLALFNDFYNHFSAKHNRQQRLRLKQSLTDLQRVLRMLAWIQQQMIGPWNSRDSKEKSLNFGMLAMSHYCIDHISFCCLEVTRVTRYTWT